MLLPGRKSRFRAGFPLYAVRGNIKFRPSGRRADFEAPPIGIRPNRPGSPISGPEALLSNLKFVPVYFGAGFWCLVSDAAEQADGNQFSRPFRPLRGRHRLHCSVNSFRFLSFLLWFVLGPWGPPGGPRGPREGPRIAQGDLPGAPGAPRARVKKPGNLYFLQGPTSRTSTTAETEQRQVVRIELGPQPS
jgi:hypothetical protein